MNLQQILSFLAALKRNNNRAWMETHKTDYQLVRNMFIDAVDYLIVRMEHLDKSVVGLESRRCIFRINRDIRFSQDKSPYKTNMGAYLAKGGRNGGYAGYYLHIEPQDRSFIAGGIYQPTADVLKKIRQEIDYNADALLAIMHAPRFKKLLRGLQGEKLKRVPKGYDAIHPQAELLKMKSFLVMHPIQDSTITQEEFLDHILEIFQEIVPFNKFLNTAIGM